MQISETGSVEYGVDHLGTPLVVVLGHPQTAVLLLCAIEGHAEGHVEDIIHDILPSVEQAKQNAKGESEIATLAETYNVQNSVNQLKKVRILSKAGSKKEK